MKRFLAFFLLIGLAHAQTIPLSINGAAKCAATQTGNDFAGVVDRACQVIPPPVGVPIYSQIFYPNNNPPSTRAAVDVTQWANLFGHVTAFDPAALFPNRGGTQPTVQRFPGNGTVAVAFVAADGRYRGWAGMGSYYGQVMDCAISESPTVWPSDLSHYKAGVRIGGACPSFTSYASTQAQLVAGRTYYYLFRLHTPRAGTVQASLTYYMSVN